MKHLLTTLRISNFLVPLIAFILGYKAIFNVGYSSRGWAEFFALESLTLLILGFIGVRYVLNDAIENKKYVVWITWSFLFLSNLILAIQFPSTLIQTLIATASVYALSSEKGGANYKRRIISNLVLLAINLGWGIFILNLIG